MICFSLRCAEGHQFESWFPSGAAFEQLQDEKRLACAVCGADGVSKDLMAPSLGATGEDRPLTRPASPHEKALADFRRKVEAETEDVGRGFAAEARRIHEGEAEARPIMGEAALPEIRALIDDGIRVAPLPWASGRRSN